MRTMKYIVRFSVLTTLLLLSCMTVVAQPRAAMQGLMTLKTYKTGGEPVGTSYACLVDRKGTVLSSWSPFNGADSAVVVDASGRSHAVEKIYGANELYDFAKFSIAGASSLTPIAQAKSLPSPSAKLWVMTRKPLDVSLSRSEKFLTKYNYYVLGNKSELQNDKATYPNGSPVVNEKGELVGIYNNGGSTLSATDYRYADELNPTGLSMNSPTLRQTTIRKALPSDLKGAQLALMMASQGRASDYIATARDFISMFPSETDGYSSLAGALWREGLTADANKALQEGIAKAADKSTAHYNYAREIWQKTAMMPEPAYPSWTYDKAMQEIDAAYKISPLPIYDEMRGKINYSKGNYAEAYNMFMKLTKSPIRNADLFYEAAQCRQQLKGSDDEILALLDSAVCACDTPYTTIAAPYFLARGEQYGKMGKYRDAMLDLYRYEMLTPSQPTAAFYYEREQYEIKGKIFQGALNDINRAVILDRNNAQLWAEKANVHLRVGQYAEAIQSADISIQLDSSYASPYLVKGLAQCQSGQKADGVQNLEKAKSLGDTQADSFITKFK